MSAAASLTDLVPPPLGPPALTLVYGRQGTDEEAAHTLRHLLGEADGLIGQGRPGEAEGLLAQAEAVARLPRFDAADRAEVVLRQGFAALAAGEVAEAAAIFTRALETNDRSARPCPRLVSRAMAGRSRCHVLRRDWTAARRDAERAVDAADRAGDDLLHAHGLLQAAAVGEHDRQWLLARCYAEQALPVFRTHGDVAATVETFTLMGRLQSLLGEIEDAERTLERAAATANGAGSGVDSAPASLALAELCLADGRPEDALRHAEAAAAMLVGRPELGTAQLLVARALAAQGDDTCGRWLDRAEAAGADRPSVWMTRAELAESRGDTAEAAALYRRSAEALRDLHF